MARNLSTFPIDKRINETKGIEGAIYKYFYGLLKTSPSDLKNPDGKEFLICMMKFYTGLGFYTLLNKYHDFLTWLTQYYPFSQLFRWKLYHADNKALRVFVKALESHIAKYKIPIIYSGWDYNQQNSELYFEFYKKVADKELIATKLERAFRKETDLYVRIDDGFLKIIVPNL